MRQAFFLAILITCTLMCYSCACTFTSETYRIEQSSDESLQLINRNGDKYSTRQDMMWFPRVIFGSDYNQSIATLAEGMLFKTTSENCLYLDSMNGKKPYMLYKSSLLTTDVSAENVVAAQFTRAENGNVTDVTGSTSDILRIYNDITQYESKKIDSPYNFWGKVSMQNKCDTGLYFDVSIYTDGNNYYFPIKNQENVYVLCNGIIPMITQAIA